MPNSVHQQRELLLLVVLWCFGCLSGLALHMQRFPCMFLAKSLTAQNSRERDLYLQLA